MHPPGSQSLQKVSGLSGNLFVGKFKAKFWPKHERFLNRNSKLQELKRERYKEDKAISFENIALPLQSTKEGDNAIYGPNLDSRRKNSVNKLERKKGVK